jgi:F-type H+-transporting ATPase subunit c
MKFRNVLMLLAALLVASPVFAQDGSAAASAAGLGYLAAGIGMAIASGLCGLGQARAVAACAEAMARNPSASAGVRFALILGLVFIESLALYTLVIIFMKVGA